jgi:hypothetical protein
MLAKFDQRVQELFRESGLDYTRVFARSSNVFYSNDDLFVKKEEVIVATLLVQRAKREVQYDDPKWYRNIVFDEESLKKLSELFPEREVKTDGDALKLVRRYKGEILNEIQRRMKG